VNLPLKAAARIPQIGGKFTFNLRCGVNIPFPILGIHRLALIGVLVEGMQDWKTSWIQMDRLAYGTASSNIRGRRGGLADAAGRVLYKEKGS
jgi:hypothetical protein